MASNKNQHFVPRCYLRQFSIDKNNKLINLFNIDRAMFFEKVPIKNQCSRNYFYGTNSTLEEAIQLSERAYSYSLAHLLDTNAQLSFNTGINILRFWHLQNSRTEAASRRSVEMFEDTGLTIGSDSEFFKLEIKDAIQMALMAFAHTMDILDDLKIVLINNKSSIPFITSDDPAVYVNRWAINNKILSGRGTGLRSAGAICILPLSPKVCFFAYDKNIYSIQHKNGWIHVKSKSDIEIINLLQYLKAFANIYFNGNTNYEHIHSLHKEYLKLRSIPKFKINYAELDETYHNGERYIVVDPKKANKSKNALVHMVSNHITPPSWPMFLHWRKGGYYLSNRTGVGPVRRVYMKHIEEPEYIKIKTGH